MPTASIEPWRVLVLNQIAQEGLARFPAERYQLETVASKPDAIVLRSTDLHDFNFPSNLLAVARAGAGTNNIPVDALSRRGIPVFNTPGANANAVKELVLASLIIGARNLADALAYTAGLAVNDQMSTAVEHGKKKFAGIELAGHTLGIIGLGKIGCMVADAALKLGMQVFGYDPEITVDAAWNLSSQVRRAHDLETLLKNCRFITIHVPLTATTRRLLTAQMLSLMPQNSLLLNFSREEVVDTEAVLEALSRRHLSAYLCDFPSPLLAGKPHVVAFPHLGASTAEAERNCATMAADQLRAFLEHGEVTHAVNFPQVTMTRESTFRIAIANANVPNMVGQISTAMAASSLNIHNMINKSRGEMAYTLVDVDSPVTDSLLDQLRAVPGVLTVRYLPLLT